MNIEDILKLPTIFGTSHNETAPILSPIVLDNQEDFSSSPPSCASSLTDFQLEGLPQLDLEINPVIKEENVEIKQEAEQNKCLNRKRHQQVHLYQFLEELLNDGSYDEFIIWTDKEKREFRFENPAGISALWGKRKMKPQMNYENLARSLRYYYERKIMAKVPGIKHTYRFVYGEENAGHPQETTLPLNLKLEQSAASCDLNDYVYKLLQLKAPTPHPEPVSRKRKGSAIDLDALNLHSNIMTPAATPENICNVNASVSREPSPVIPNLSLFGDQSFTNTLLSAAIMPSMVNSALPAFNPLMIPALNSEPFAQQANQLLGNPLLSFQMMMTGNMQLLALMNMLNSINNNGQ